MKRRLDSLLNSLTRVTSTGSYIPEIDGFRCLAIALVVLFHINAMDMAAYPNSATQTALFKVLSRGHLGVQFFFVISGFVIAMPFVNALRVGHPRVSLKSYYVRRLTRLEPPYMLAMSGYYLLAVCFTDHPLRDLASHFAASLFYLHGFIYDAKSLINSVAWSLEVEIQFYLLAPLLFQCLKWPAQLRRLAFTIVILVAPRLSHGSLDSGLSLSSQVHFFIAGALLADLYFNRHNHKRHFAMDLVALTMLALVYLVPRGPALEASLAVLIFVFFHSSLHSLFLRKLFRFKVVTVVGGMCYSIYLIHLEITHQTVLLLQSQITTGRYGWDVLVFCAVTIPLLLVVCTVFFVLVEKPFMERKWHLRLLAAIDRLTPTKHAPDGPIENPQE